MISLVPSFFVLAQEKPNIDNGGEMVQANYTNMIVPIVIVGLLVFLIVSIFKYVLEYRLKNKIIDKGISEQLSASILQKNNSNINDETMKFAILLCGIGAGLIFTYYTKPLDIHSLAIMAFCIGFSYFAYFFYLKNQKR